MEGKIEITYMGLDSLRLDFDFLLCDVMEAGKLEGLKVEQCKVYLRKNKLRLTGKKDTLIQRIKEHQE